MFFHRGNFKIKKFAHYCNNNLGPRVLNLSSLFYAHVIECKAMPKKLQEDSSLETRVAMILKEVQCSFIFCENIPPTFPPIHLLHPLGRSLFTGSRKIENFTRAFAKIPE